MREELDKVEVPLRAGSFLILGAMTTDGREQRSFHHVSVEEGVLWRCLVLNYLSFSTRGLQVAGLRD